MLAQPTSLKGPPVDIPERDPINRSVGIGIVCTILFHILLLLFAQHFSFQRFSGIHTGINIVHSRRDKTFDFQLTPAPPVQKPRDPFRYVDTNSAAPENIPDKTSNFSNRNQQSAQEVAAKEKDPENRPSVQGQDKIKNDTAIVSGQMAPPQPPSAPAKQVAKEEAKDQTQQKARAEQVPLTGFDKTEGKSADGIATNIAQAKDATTHADKFFEGAKNGKDPTGGLVAIPDTMHAPPRERPRLSSTSLNRSTILTTRVTGTTNVGIVGIDARWSEYGEYLNEMLEIIQRQWYKILEESQISPPRGSNVLITFRINSQGVTDIRAVENTDAGKQGVWFCQSAITDPSPYRKWSDQMIAVLGDSQEIKLAFYYQ